MSADRRPIVIGGCHRSGTSLLRRILDGHSQIHCGPEVPFLRDFHGDYRDDSLSHVRFATNARHLLPEPELLGVLGRAFVEVHEHAARRAGKRRWADKAPENLLYAGEWEQILGEGWVLVHVVRNPLDTIASMTEAGFPLTLPPDLEGRIALYRRYAEAGLEFEAKHADRYRRVTYEAVCDSPQAEVAELMSWLGEAFEPRQLELEAGSSGGLEDPKVAETTTVHRESVGRWEQVLAPDQAKLVWSQTVDLWRRFDPDRRFLALE